MENDYRITKLHGTLIGDNRIPDLPGGEKTKVFSSTNGKTAWVDLPDGGEIEVIDGTVISAQGNETEFTIETEPKGKVFLLKLPIASILMSLMLPSDNTYCGFCFGGTGSFGVIVEAKTKTGAMLSISTDYWLNADSTKNGKFLSVVEGIPEWSDLPDGGELELIEVSNGTHNSDGSYTYTLPKKPTSNPYILKTVDSGESAYYLMTGDSDVSFGMRPIALADSLFGGNFMVVSGTTAIQRPTYFPPQPKSADNGKVLTVNNGYPSWETAGGAIPVVEVTSHDGSITLPEAQTTNFIIHNEEIGYIYVNNINGTYSAIIPVGKDIAYVLTGAETTITLSFPILLNMVEGTAGELVDGKVSISIPSSHDFPFLLNIDRQGIFYISAYENNSNEIVYDGIGARKDNAGNNQLAIFSGKGTNLTMDVVPLGGGTSTSIAFQDVTVSELANHVGEFGNFHITDLKLVYDSFLGPQEFTGGYFIGTVASSTALAGVMWVVVDTQSNQTAYYKSDNFSISNGKITLQQTETLGVIKSLPFPKKINSQDGYNFLSEVIDTGSIVYAGEADIDSSSISHLILGLSSNVVPTATGDEEYCHFDCIVEEKGIGRLSLKKDANNIPQFKSFTTWLPPVTSADEGKSLVIKNGNAQWTDLTSIHNHTIVIKEGSKIIFAANKDLSSATPATTLDTLISTFKGTTTAGFGDYILLTVDTTAKLTKQDGTETDLSTLTVTIEDTVK